MDYLINILPLLLFIFIWRAAVRLSGRLISLSSFILGLYTLSMFCFYICTFYKADYTYTLKALLILTLNLIAPLVPLILFEKKIKHGLPQEFIRPNFIRGVSYFVIIISTYSILFFAKNINDVFSQDISAVRTYIENGGSFYQSNIYSKIAVLGAYLSPIGMYLFYYLTCSGNKKFYVKLLLISSISIILYTLNVAGRDGIIIWILSFLSLFAFFYPLLPNQLINKFFKIITLGIILVSPIFGYITMQRFDNIESDSSVIFSTMDYLGQQLPEMSKRIQKLETLHYQGELRSICPILVSAIESANPWSKASNSGLNRFELRENSMNIGLDTQRFPYYSGDLYTELGMTGLVIFSILLTAINLGCFNPNRTSFSFHANMTGFVCCFTLIMGVFYFYFGQLVGNFFLLTPSIIAIIAHIYNKALQYNTKITNRL